LVGTAHISKKSAEEVKEVIDKVNPDCILVELCDKRAEQIRRKLRIDPNTKQLSILEGTIPPAFSPQGPFGHMMKGLYDMLRVLGFDPGLEMKVAMEEAANKRIPLVLGDQDVQVTMQRVGAHFNLSKLLSMATSKVSNMPNLGGSLSDLKDIDQAIEKLKDRKTAREVTRLMDHVAPEIMRGLLHERDEFMARKIRQTPGTKLVGVVGLAHLDGLERLLLGNKPPAVGDHGVIQL
jgi:pheromone shutdown protein TraB